MTDRKPSQKVFLVKNSWRRSWQCTAVRWISNVHSLSQNTVTVHLSYDALKLLYFPLLCVLVLFSSFSFLHIFHLFFHFWESNMLTRWKPSTEFWAIHGERKTQSSLAVFQVILQWTVSFYGIARPMYCICPQTYLTLLGLATEQCIASSNVGISLLTWSVLRTTRHNWRLCCVPLGYYPLH